jgi:hypothetical protein
MTKSSEQKDSPQYLPVPSTVVGLNFPHTSALGKSSLIHSTYKLIIVIFLLLDLLESEQSLTRTVIL